MPKFVVEKSYEATTLDYLAPRWFEVASFEGEGAQAEAEEAAAEAQPHPSAPDFPFVIRVREVKPVVYMDDADAMWSQRFWADRARAAEAQQAAEAAYMQRTDKGRPVRVVKGRKVPVGTEGHVFWSGPDRYKAGSWRIGLKDAAGETHWTSADNVEVIEAVTAPEAVTA